MPELVDLLDLSAGWRRAKRDLLEKRTFVRHPFQMELVEMDVPGWLQNLDEAIRAHNYAPAPMDVCEVPKAGGAIRPGSILALEDAVVYSACVDAAYVPLYNYITANTGSRDYSYQLKKPETREGWFLNKFSRWRRFDQDSVDRIDQGCQWVVVADIAGYYEHIDLSTLSYDLRSVGVDQSVIDVMSSLLNAWAKVPSRGIPQGQSASDVLGKLYLSNVDYNLQQLGFDHVRYVDDIRVFCTAYPTARRAVLALSALLRARGLSVQTAKLKILRADEARVRFEGVKPIVATTSKLYHSASVASARGPDNGQSRRVRRNRSLSPHPCLGRADESS